MKGFAVAIEAELMKAYKSKVFFVTIGFFMFIATMMALLVYIAGHPEIAGRSAMVSAKAELIGKGDWPAFMGLLVQIILALGALGSGVVTAWIFGREYSDRTLKDVLILPVSRLNIILAKFVVALVWSLLLCLVLIITAVVLALVLNIPGWSSAVFITGMKTYMTAGGLTILMIMPVAYMANIGRGYLLPLGYTILTLVLTQLVMVGLPEAVNFVPWALPAQICGVTGSGVPPVNITGVAVYLILIIAGLAGTIHWWEKADHI